MRSGPTPARRIVDNPGVPHPPPIRLAALALWLAVGLLVVARPGGVQAAAACGEVRSAVAPGERLEIHANGELVGTDLVWPSVRLIRSDGRSEPVDEEVRMPDNAWWVVVRFEPDDAGVWTAELTLPDGSGCADRFRVGAPDTSTDPVAARGEPATPPGPASAVAVGLGALLAGLGLVRRTASRRAR